MRSSTLDTSSDISRALVSIERASASARRLVEARAARRERAARARDHRERRAQIVRDRREQRVAQALALGRDARRLRPVSASRARSSARPIWPRTSRADGAARAAARAGDSPAAPRARRAARAITQRQVQRRRGRQRVGCRAPRACRDRTHCATARSAPRTNRPAAARAGIELAVRVSGSSTTAWHSKTSATCLTATRAMLAVPRVAASSRLIA